MQVLAVGRCSSPEPEEWMQNLGYNSCKGGGVQLAVGLCIFSTTLILGLGSDGDSSKAHTHVHTVYSLQVPIGNLRTYV